MKNLLDELEVDFILHKNDVINEIKKEILQRTTNLSGESLMKHLNHIKYIDENIAQRPILADCIKVEEGF